MRDYEKLIVDLQKMKSTEYCVIASQEDFKAYKILREAICAIEELQAKNDKQTMMIRKQSERTKELLAAVPHWISVEERLPKKDEMVIVYYSWTGQSGTEYKEVSLATLDEMRYCGSKWLDGCRSRSRRRRCKMADILIFGMKMPENEPLRLVLNPNGQLFVDHGVTFTEYEAIELPEHGDLIDRDAFDADARKRYCSDCNNYNGTKCRACWVDDMLSDIADFETVIPATKED